jgi:general secretion pathway protein D
MNTRALPCLTTALVVLVAGCATPRPLAVPPGLEVPPATREAGLTVPPTGGESSAALVLREHDTPSPPGTGGPTLAGERQTETLPPGLSGDPVSVNVSNVPIPTFINEVLGNLLDLTFKLDPAVEKRTDLVTLRTSEPQAPVELFRIARVVLADYGIEMLVTGPVVRVQMAPAGVRAEPPLVYSGRALPEVPVTHRPVFYMMELQAIRSNEAARLLRSVYGDEVKAEEVSERNALMLSGRPEQVRQAVDALQVFDRPHMRGRSSIRLEPVFMSAEQLAGKLTEVLVAQGYGASNTLGVPSSILVLPVPATNSVILFAADQALLRHATQWARDLDRPNPAAGSQSVFYYPVKNTKAAEIAGILAGSGASAASAVVAPGAAVPAAAVSTAAPRGLIVDEPRNALIYQGDPAQWERLLPLIRQMDREARQVMIEVTIAEVSLDDNEEFGVSWFAKGDLGRFNGRLNSGMLPLVGAVAGGPGLTYLLDVAGQNRALLSAVASDSRVSILSTPRLLVKSGEEASIDVGTEVPIITARQTSPQQIEGSTGLLQSIQYRKTGIILNVKPTVYSEDRVDLLLSQEVSEVMSLQPGNTTGSPSIFNRSVQTSLTLRDGGSIVLGGLMSQNTSKSDAGIPFIKDVPIVGSLFKSEKRGGNKRELVLMISAYIVGSDERAQNLTDAIRDELQLIELPPRSEAAPPATAP